MKQDDNAKVAIETDLALVSASEISTYVYCPEAWRLQHSLKLPSDNAKALVRGTTGHARWQGRERRTRVLLRVGIIGMMVALGLLMLRALVG